MPAISSRGRVARPSGAPRRGPSTPLPAAWHAAAEAETADESTRRLISGALAVFLLISVARVHTMLGGIGDALPLGKLTVALLALAAWHAFTRDDVRRLFATVPARAFAVIVVLAVLSTPFGIWKSNSLATLIGPFPPLVALFFLGSMALAASQRTLRTCMATLVVGVALGAVQVMRGIHVREGRATLGGGLDPNDTAALMVSAIPIALTLSTERGVVKRIAFTGIALLAVGALVKTGSRGGMLGLVVMAVALIAVSRGRQRLHFLAMIVVGGLVFSVSAQDRLRERFATTFETDYNQTHEDGRVEIWKRGLGYMAKNPVLGVGLANFGAAEGMLSSKATDRFRRRGVKFAAAHNSFIQVGAELGVGGLVALVAMISTGLVGCWRIARNRDGVYDPTLLHWARAAFVSLAGFTVSAFFLSLAYTPMLIIVVTICTAMMIRAARVRALAAADAPAGAPAEPSVAPAVGAPGAGWRSAGSRRFARG